MAPPADFEQRFPPGQRALILAHEQVHRARLDNAWNLLACVLTALHWWNPIHPGPARRPRPPPPRRAAGQQLRLEVSYRSGDARTCKTLSTQTTLRVKVGERATLMFNGEPDAPMPESLAIAIVARDLGDDKIELQTEVSKGSPLTVAYKPRLISRNGVKALIKQG